MKSMYSGVAASALAIAMAAGSAHGQFVASAIYSQSPTAPTNIVPGTTGANLGERFGNVTLSLTAQFMDRVYRSSNGGHFILTARTNTGTATGQGNGATVDEVVITGTITPNGVGAVPTITSQVRVREGAVLFGGADAGLAIESGTIDERVSVNNSGDFAFTANLLPTGAPTTDELIIRGTSAGVISIEAREGQVMTAAGVPAGFINGPTISSANINNAGQIGFRTSVTTTNVVNFNPGATAVNAAIGAANTPNAAANFPLRPYDSLDSDGYHIDPVTNDWVSLASLNGSTTDDGVMVYNNAALMQEGVTTIGGGANNTVSTYAEWGIIPAGGGWWARGSNLLVSGGSSSDVTDWVVRGNATGFNVIASTDQPITTAATELWDDSASTGNATTFFAFFAANNGDYVIGGTTNASNTAANAVLVYNGVFGNFVVFREGDQVDITGDGILDDAFITTFSNDDGFLTDSGILMFQANLRDGAGVGLGQALLVTQIPTPGAAALLGLGGLAIVRRRR
jgi:uncharacterized protein (TIGR03382 family)